MGAPFRNSLRPKGMLAPMYLRVNKPKVILETFDDEVVLVNLDSGSYYTIDNVGLDIWVHIEQGAGTDEIVKKMIDAHEADSTHEETAVLEFVDELAREGLVVPAERPDTGAAQAEAEVVAKQPGFDPPVLRGYTDMQDLLLLDPIHEVDETGWPNVKQPDPS